MLAGVSVDYYTRLERGKLQGVSDGVLEALARALQLDEAERAHLFDLARTVNSTPGVRRRSAAQRVRPSLQRVLDSMTAPAWVRNERMDVLAYNRLGRVLYAEIFTDPVRPANSARFVFLNPRSREFFVDWEHVANDVVAILRAEAGREPYDKALTDLVGELSTRSEKFRERWAAHNVRLHRSTRKQFHYPVVGFLDLAVEAMEFPGEGMSLFVYTAEPATPSQDALNLLASWAATLDLQERAEAEDASDRP
jgi:hypothetical protein